MKRTTLLLLTGGLVDEVGFRITQVVLPLIALSATDSLSAVGLVAGGAGIPTVLAPWWTRRLRQRITSTRALASLHLAEGVVLCAIPVALTTGTVTAPLLAAVGLFRGLVTALAMPARSALMADLGDSERHSGAARLLAWDDAQTRIAMVAGPPVGAVLWAAGSMLAASAAVATCGIAAALCALTRFHAESTAGQAPSIRSAVAGHHEIIAGWLVRGTGCLCWFAFILGLPVVGSGATLAAVAFSAYGLGGVAAVVISTRAVGRPSPLAYAGTGWAICGVAFAAMGVSTSGAVVVTAALVAGVATPVGNACITALVVRRTAGSERRAALAGQRTMVTATSTLGMMVGGPLFALVGTRPAMTGAGVLVAAAAVVVTRAARRSPARPVRTGSW